MPQRLPPMRPAYQGGAVSLDVVQQIQDLFGQHGGRVHDLDWPGPVTMQEHALQCAQLAEWSQAPPALVAAGLLHDIGHLLALSLPSRSEEDDAHELRALGLLGTAFGRDVLEPIRLHVQAKRYLVAMDEQYRRRLSRASLASLSRQGGPMSAGEAQAFEELQWAGQAVALRRWDDGALTCGKRTAPLSYYLDLLETLRNPPSGSRTPMGPPDIS